MDITDELMVAAQYERHGGRASLMVQAAKELARLRKENEDLREALSLLYSQNKCGCGHPACSKCANDRIAEAALKL